MTHSLKTDIIYAANDAAEFFRWQGQSEDRISENKSKNNIWKVLTDRHDHDIIYELPLRAALLNLDNKRIDNIPEDSKELFREQPKTVNNRMESEQFS